jgi:hypothetical protein
VWRWILAAALTPAAGCSFHTGYGAGYQCGAGDTCPTGQACVSGYCVAPGPGDASPDGGGGGDGGGPDGAPPAARCGATTLLRDDFEASKPARVWEVWSDSGVTASQTGGAASIQIPSGSADNWGGFGARYYYDLTDSEVQATIGQVGGVDTVLEVRNPDNGKLQMVVENGVLDAGVFNLPGGGTRASVTYDPGVHKHWRIRERAGTVHWEWSTDGAAWNELWSEADPFSPADAAVQLAAGGELANASEARYDEINTLTSTPALGFCAAETVVDGFDSGSFGPVWSPWNDSPSMITEAGGVVVLTFPDGTGDVWAGFETRHLFDLTQSAIWVDVLEAPTVATFVTYFDLYEPGNTGDRLEFNLEADTLQLIQFVGDSPVSEVDLTYDPGTQRYWRLRGAGGTVYFDVSSDAATWTNKLAATAQVDLTAMQVEIGAGHYAPGPGGAEAVTFGGVDVP